MRKSRKILLETRGKKGKERKLEGIKEREASFTGHWGIKKIHEGIRC